MDGAIVVVDDERDVLNVLCEALEEEGFRVICLDHPRQAASLKHEAEPCLFLIDLMLPDETGIELAQELQARSFGAVPMIAMSASTAMVQQAWSTGLFRETISKPFDLDQLLRTVEHYVA